MVAPKALAVAMPAMVEAAVAMTMGAVSAARRGWAGAGISAVLLGGLAMSVAALVGFLFAGYIPWDMLLPVAAAFAFTGLPMSLFLPEGKVV